MHPQLGQHPDAVGELHGLVKHVLTLHRPLGDGEDVAALQLVGGGVWWGDRGSSLSHESYLTTLTRSRQNSRSRQRDKLLRELNLAGLGRINVSSPPSTPSNQSHAVHAANIQVLMQINRPPPASGLLLSPSGKSNPLFLFMKTKKN